MSKRAKDINKAGGWIQIYPTSRGTWTVRALVVGKNGKFKDKRIVGIKEPQVADHVNTRIIDAVRDALDWLENIK